MTPGMAAIRRLMFVGLALFAFGCKRHTPPATSAIGAVRFEGAGASLVPGEGWTEQRERDLSHSQIGQICLPVLEGQGEFAGSTIQVLLLSGSSDPEARAASLRKKIESQTDIIRTSFRQEVFSTAAGLRGTHLEYNEKARDRTWLVRNHLYLLKKKGGCVGVAYLTRPNKDSPAVHQMIRRTLALD